MEIKREKHTIDAANRILGRLATEIAVLLRGKQKPNFMLNLDMGDFVTVENSDKIKLSGKKADQKMYYRFTGYVGNLKAISMRQMKEKTPKEVLRKAVLGMLPKNRLRSIQIKRLKIK